MQSSQWVFLWDLFGSCAVFIAYTSSLGFTQSEATLAADPWTHVLLVSFVILVAHPLLTNSTVSGWALLAQGTLVMACDLLKCILDIALLIITSQSLITSRQSPNYVPPQFFLGKHPAPSLPLVCCCRGCAVPGNTQQLFVDIQTGYCRS